MKLLLLTQYFQPENFQINSVAQTLRGKGVEVEVLTGKPNYPCGEIFAGYRAWGCQREIWSGIPIARIPLVARGRGGWRLVVNYLSFVVSGLLFAPWLLRGKTFDSIFVYAPSPILQAIPALFLGWLKNVPVAVWVQDLWPESLSATGYVRNRAILALARKVVRFIYRHTDLLLVQSRAFEEPVRALASHTRIVYHPNSADETFVATDLAPSPAVEGVNAKFCVLFAGNIGTAQAVEVIVEAATLLRDHADIHFVVLGDGSRRDWIRTEAAARGLVNLHLPGRFPVETMPGFMRQASALLVTLADQEIFHATVPSKVQAYLAAGKPILASLNGEGARLVTEAGAGLAVPAEDAHALADAVLQLYRMPTDVREAMGARGRVFYETHFSHDRLAEQLIDHLQTMREQKGNPG
jgi:glycosyltransferase involved in cell wall biosynthesis